MQCARTIFVSLAIVIYVENIWLDFFCLYKFSIR